MLPTTIPCVDDSVRVHLGGRGRPEGVIDELEAPSFNQQCLCRLGERVREQAAVHHEGSACMHQLPDVVGNVPAGLGVPVIASTVPGALNFLRPEFEVEGNDALFSEPHASNLRGVQCHQQTCAVDRVAGIMMVCGCRGRLGRLSLKQRSGEILGEVAPWVPLADAVPCVHDAARRQAARLRAAVDAEHLKRQRVHPGQRLDVLPDVVHQNQIAVVPHTASAGFAVVYQATCQIDGSCSP
mmetsp:Transcript_30838/g.89692  ORF Transcript_30838/g.89692 Transcript_30838/m.89692 type:complete len:240 (+) Transcript_30838:715-1434(+)